MWRKTPVLSLILAGAALLLAGAAVYPRAAKRGPSHHSMKIPEIGKFAGLTCGYNVIGQAQLRYGPGLEVTGEHPQGARVWRSRETGWYLFVDGFDIRPVEGLPEWAEPYVINQMCIASKAEDLAHGISERVAEVPSTSLTAEQASLFKTIRLGMGEGEVLAILKAKHISPKRDGDSLSWSETGFVRVNALADGSYHTWDAELDFDAHQVLEETSVGCE